MRDTKTKPPKSILDRDFRYVPAARTNIAATFARLRRQAKMEEAKPATPKVRLIRKSGG